MTYEFSSTVALYSSGSASRNRRNIRLVYGGHTVTQHAKTATAATTKIIRGRWQYFHLQRLEKRPKTLPCLTGKWVHNILHKYTKKISDLRLIICSPILFFSARLLPRFSNNTSPPKILRREKFGHSFIQMKKAQICWLSMNFLELTLAGNEFRHPFLDVCRPFG
jgi:hypothetical protein